MSRDDPLTGSLARFARPRGRALLDRTMALADWIDARAKRDLWPYMRSLHSGALPEATLQDVNGELFEGVNFTSQDYLGLSTHPAVIDAAVEAARRYGVHSGGSGVVAGGSAESLLLESEIADLVQAEHVLLFPTGWGAGFGTISGLVRPYDHVLLDELAHACLQQGAHAATANVKRHAHLDHESLGQQLAAIRAQDAKGAILVVTEGLYSMDADSPRLARYVELVREYDATLLVDQAHDLGSSGPGGTGQLGLQQLLGQADLVMGAFSKTFAANGGFVATRSRSARQFLMAFGGPFTFSNALSPIQVATVRQTLRIVRSPEGDQRRRRLLEVCLQLRAELAERGYPCLGQPAAVNPVLVGSEAVAGTATALLSRRGVLVNLAEFPVVAVGAARLRLQAMATHTTEHVHTAAQAVADALDEAREHLASQTERRPPTSRADITAASGDEQPAE